MCVLRQHLNKRFNKLLTRFYILKKVLKTFAKKNQV
jgi:hypothetical protein